MDVAFVVDTTGSMKDDIRAVKDNLSEIVNHITSGIKDLEIRFGVVSYRDHPPQDKSYVTKVFDFTDNVKRVKKLIDELRPSEGGDTPEAVADGLFDARTKLSWEKDSYKVMLLVGDAPPHGKKYNSIGDDYFPDGCPQGHDSIEEVQQFRIDFGSTMFIFICGCNPLVEVSFRMIADSVDEGKYYSLLEAHELPEAVLQILKGVSDLIEADRKVLAYYENHDGIFDMGEAASNLSLQVRELKTSLSRLLALGRITRWPKGRPLAVENLGVNVELGEVPNNIVTGKTFNYLIRVNNPSTTIVSVRVIATLVTSEGVSEVTNERHDLSPKSDKMLELKLTPMTDVKVKATLRVEVFYGSKSVATELYDTRIY
ncbi:MAG: VWA domain-containing protein [Candidatus Thorarchaeota archaeon]|nr:MAG: VWA domain-containing protein [Candidatus Thorarchaeota archaeon]